MEHFLKRSALHGSKERYRKKTIILSLKTVAEHHCPLERRDGGENDCLLSIPFFTAVVLRFKGLDNLTQKRISICIFYSSHLG